MTLLININLFVTFLGAKK